jgi:hypothetical protein
MGGWGRGSLLVSGQYLSVRKVGSPPPPTPLSDGQGPFYENMLLPPPLTRLLKLNICTRHWRTQTISIRLKEIDWCFLLACQFYFILVFYSYF